MPSPIASPDAAPLMKPLPAASATNSARRSDDASPTRPSAPAQR